MAPKHSKSFRPRICVLRAPGTNCDAETVSALEYCGAEAVVRHVNTFKRPGQLEEFNGLVFPGGFSFGDHVRSGIIFARKFAAHIGRDLEDFVEAGKPVLGICNGMQVLVEAGLIPGNMPAAMYTNDSAKFECRWIRLMVEPKGKSLFTKGLKGTILMPIAHGEGKFSLEPGREQELADQLADNGQIIFRYANEKGKPAEGVYPINPNGAIADIAGVANPKGNVMALMPHPERASFEWQYPDWTRAQQKECAPLKVFENMVCACTK